MNLSQMRERLQALGSQAANYAQGLGQAVSDQTTEASKAAAHYAELMRSHAENVENLTSEELNSRLEELTAVYLANPNIGSRIMGLGAEMETNAGTMVTGVVMIVTGLFLAFMGRRIFNAFIIISGFFVFSSAAIMATIFARSHFGIETSSLAFWGISIVVGLIGSYVFYKSLKFAVYCMSFYGGVLAAFWIFGMVPEIKKYVNKTIFVCACSALAGICARYNDEMVVIVSSSLVGAFAAALGADMIKPNGFRTNIVALVECSDADSARNIASEFLIGNVRNYMIGVLFVTAVGIYIQYRHQPRSYDRE